MRDHKVSPRIMIKHLLKKYFTVNVYLIISVLFTQLHLRRSQKPLKINLVFFLGCFIFFFKRLFETISWQLFAWNVEPLNTMFLNIVTFSMENTMLTLRGYYDIGFCFRSQAKEIMFLKWLPHIKSHTNPYW